MKTYELSDYADNVVGSNNAEAIFAYAGNDIVTAGAGNDMVSGGDGNDQIDGGKGDDSLYGNNGNDTILGGAGADLMDGGGGNDTYVVDSASDQIVEYAGTSTDTVRTTLASYTLGAEVENLTYTGSAAQVFSGYGNALNNTLTGSGGIDILKGNAGDDKFFGNGANDTLIGDDGADKLNGGSGADKFVMDVISSSDTIMDFEKTLDKIDLSSFDAVAGMSGDQAFIFLGKNAFIGEGEGSVRYTNETSSSCRVFVDVNGDAKSDFDFLVAANGGAALTLTASDFIL